MDKEYLYHCAGCKKEDKEYPDKDIECDECQGTGYEEAHQGKGCRVFYGTDENFCNMCNGHGAYTPRAIQIKYHMWARCDAYGIYTGLYCDECYKSNYPFKKDRYFDPAYAGESLEAEE